MALSTSYSWRGVTMNAAYVRIRTVFIDIDARAATVDASVYASSEARTSGAQEIEQVRTTFSLDLQQPLATQAYAALKLLPALAASVDT